VDEVSRRQRQALDALRRLHDPGGSAPSRRQVACEVGRPSARSVHGLVATLAERGRIERHPDRPRSLRMRAGRSR
jgi:SOS-response transcriptional repressor LexA